MLNKQLKSAGILMLILAVAFTFSACDLDSDTTPEEDDTHTISGYVYLQSGLSTDDVLLNIGDDDDNVITPEDDGSWEAEVESGDTITITPELIEDQDDYFWYSLHTDWQEEDDIWVKEINEDIEDINFHALLEEGISTVKGYSFIANQGVYYAQQEKIDFVVRIHDNIDEIITDNIELTELYIDGEERTEDSKIEHSHVHGDEEEISEWEVIIENVEELPAADAEISLKVEHTETDTTAKFTNTWQNIRQEEFDEGISSTHSYLDWYSGVHDQVDDELNYEIGLTSVEEEAITSPDDINIVSHSIDGEDYTEDTQLEFDFEADGGAGIWNLEVKNVVEEPDEESVIELVLEHRPTDTETALDDHWGRVRDEKDEHYNIKFTDGTADELNPMGYFDVEVEVTNIGYVEQDSILGIPIRVADERDWDWDEFLFYHRELYVAEDLSPGESTIVENEYIFGVSEEEIEADEYELIAEINEYTEDNGDYEGSRTYDATFKEVNIGDPETTQIEEGSLDATDVESAEEQNQDIFFELEQISDDNAAATNWMGIRWGEDIDDIETEDDIYTELIKGLDDLADEDVTIKSGDEEINAEIDHEHFTDDDNNYLNLHLPEPLADIAEAGDEVTVEISDGLNFSDADLGEYDIRVNLFHGNHRLDRELSEEIFSVD